MNLDFRKTADQNKARVYLDKLITDQSSAELTKINKRRTSSQNRYVHALFQLWGNHFGYTLDESKAVSKMALGYTYEKDGHTFLSKTSEMDTRQLSEFVSKYRNWSASEGCWLPSADEFQENYITYMKEIERAEIIEKRYGY